ncbi:hypothetical protein ONZ45_g831 [Pleurotus djamor]|nr:hypothetical protein ONZ45_g831 [Pleurotus djamor]
MHFSMKFAVLASLAYAALVSASPTPSVEDGGALEARGPRGRPTQQECEVACTLSGFVGAQWQQCVRECMATNYPSPPPSPQNRKKAKGKRDNARLEARGPRGRPTQQECEVACTLSGFVGAQWQQCVRDCMATNYPSPPPSPQNKKKAKGKREDEQLEARGPRARPTQQECEVACTLSGFVGAQWQQCVRDCMATNYPSPPPSPLNKKKAKGNREAEELDTRGPRSRPTQQECEVACTLSGFVGAQWQQCVRECMATNYPSPPPSPQNKKKTKGKRGAEELEARGPLGRPTQQECEVACTLSGFVGAQWQQCVRECMATNYPTPPPSPQNKKKVKGKRAAGEDSE